MCIRAEKKADEKRGIKYCVPRIWEIKLFRFRGVFFKGPKAMNMKAKHIFMVLLILAVPVCWKVLPLAYYGVIDFLNYPVNLTRCNISNSVAIESALKVLSRFGVDAQPAEITVSQHDPTVARWFRLYSNKNYILENEKIVSFPGYKVHVSCFDGSITLFDNVNYNSYYSPWPEKLGESDDANVTECFNALVHKFKPEDSFRISKVHKLSNGLLEVTARKQVNGFESLYPVTMDIDPDGCFLSQYYNSIFVNGDIKNSPKIDREHALKIASEALQGDFTEDKLILGKTYLMNKRITFEPEGLSYYQILMPETRIVWKFEWPDSQFAIIDAESGKVIFAESAEMRQIRIDRLRLSK